MDKRSAIRLVQDTLESAFDKSKFAYLVSNMLDHIEAAPFIYRGNLIPDAYKPYISTLERIGKYKDREGNKIDLLIVQLKKETSLERARTMQRNFIAWYLNGSRGDILKDAALAAFVSPDTEDWRFSLVKMDYRLDTSGEKVKVKKELTPARRFSFLVGKNENSHTAQSCLLPVLEKKVQDPILKEIEQAFDIETVTKEFFLKYRELFLHTKEELDRVVKKDPKIKADFEAKGVDTVNFAKKLLGQIIFLYFLQKKGWFGVGRDNNWGTGSKHFLRELFEKKHGDYNNFFNDILEPLFYEALRTGEDRKHEDYYYSRFNCKIPFLNGGLFDPIGNYDWVRTDILIPDRLFSNNVKTKEDDKGTGILDVFDRYNFTVKEDEPLEKEVAIDPELLGKSYEKFNAIRPDNFAEFKKALKSGKKGEENKFNKKFGVYYTPREIVHYMCQQSLINYLSACLAQAGLATELSASHSRESGNPVVLKEHIEALIHTGEQVSENEARVLSKGKETKTYSHQLPESIRKKAKLIDDKLAEIMVCDPAVGSGAFPVGMMSEIVKIRNVLTPFLSLRGAQATKQSQFDDNRTVYNFKRQCIEHSLYGVDIDPGAVEIAKLRLWLSLVVDEDNIKNIKPLPNLDYRIMQGNSLISEFMGISFDEDENKNLKQNIDDLGIEIKELDKQIKDKEKQFLRYYNKTKKQDQNLSNKLDELANRKNDLKKNQTQLIKKLNNPQNEDPEIIDIISEFQKKKNNFLNESNVTKKSQLKNEVDDLLVKIFETKLRTQKPDYFNRLKNIENKYSVVRNEKQRDEFVKQDKKKLNKEFGFDPELAEKQLKEFTSGRKIKPFFLWNLYFSEVFLRGAKSASGVPNKSGFDVVIANPPYVAGKSGAFNTSEKQYFNKNYEVAEYQLDTYILFAEKGLKICRENGVLTYIMPNTWLANLKLIKIRKFLLDNSSLLNIVINPDDIFEAAVVDTIILITLRGKRKGNNISIGSFLGWEFQKSNSIDQDVFCKNEKFIFDIHLDNYKRAIILKIEDKSLKVRDLCYVNRGVHAYRKDGYGKSKFGKGFQTERDYIEKSYHSNKKLDNTYYREVRGKNVFPYFFELSDKYVSWGDWLAEPREWKYFTGERIYLRKIVGETLYAAHVNNINIADQSVYIAKVKDKDVDTKFLLSLFNSKLLTWYFRVKTNEFDKLFPQIKVTEFKELPVRVINNQQSFITLVDCIIEITKSEDYLENPKKQAEVKSLEAEIDQLVYKLYDLTPEEIKIVEGEIK